MPPRRGSSKRRPDVISYTPLTHIRDHTDFSESTEELAPLTEEEKKARLEELRQKLKEKRANQSIAEKEEAKRNEVCRTIHASPAFH
jgi:hypothetical protein